MTYHVLLTSVNANGSRWSPEFRPQLKQPGRRTLHLWPGNNICGVLCTTTWMFESQAGPCGTESQWYSHCKTWKTSMSVGASTCWAGCSQCRHCKQIGLVTRARRYIPVPTNACHPKVATCVCRRRSMCFGMVMCLRLLCVLSWNPQCGRLACI